MWTNGVPISLRSSVISTVRGSEKQSEVNRPPPLQFDPTCQVFGVFGREMHGRIGLLQNLHQKTPAMGQYVDVFHPMLFCCNAIAQASTRCNFGEGLVSGRPTEPLPP